MAHIQARYLGFSMACSSILPGTDRRRRPRAKTVIGRRTTAERSEGQRVETDTCSARQSGTRSPNRGHRTLGCATVRWAGVVLPAGFVDVSHSYT